VVPKRFVEMVSPSVPMSRAHSRAVRSRNDRPRRNVNSHHVLKRAPCPARSARTAMTMVKVLDHSRIDARIGRSSTSRGVGPLVPFPT
jgi:hypothetical protein